MVNAAADIQSAVKTTRATDLVQDYLDSLLRDVSANVEVMTVEPVTDTSAEVNLPPPTTETASNQRLHDDAPASQTSSAIAAPDKADPDRHVSPLQLPALDPAAKRTVPVWASSGFAGLLFDVCGLKMAAPLHTLGGISLIGDALQPLVGQADWLLGLLRWNGRNLRVIDTARFVMPERLTGDSHQKMYKSVIVLGDSHWALAVDCADESVSLDKDEIRWKQFAGSRPWLAGTLLNRLCALMDVDNLMLMLESHEEQIRLQLKTQ